jgi:hypothetical protein
MFEFGNAQGQTAKQFWYFKVILKKITAHAF